MVTGSDAIARRVRPCRGLRRVRFGRWAVARGVHSLVPVVWLCVHGCLGQSVVGDYRPRDGHVE